VSAAAVDLLVEQGATWEQDIIWKDSNGALVDVTGYTGSMDVRESQGAVDPVIVAPTIAFGTTDGKITLTLTAAQTAALDAAGDRSWVYDLFVTSPTNVVTRLMAGQFNVIGSVTHP